MKSIALALTTALAFGTVALAAPPAPTITVGANDIKQLQFDITPVPQVIWYELWFKANSGANWTRYTKTPAQQPLFRISTSVHLLDWTQARYLVKACNPSGCSESNQVGVNGLQLDSMGYFKSLTAGTATQQFGAKVAASADGGTIAVASNEDVGPVPHASVIHVYRKTTWTSGWRREARLQPDKRVEDGFGLSGGDQLAISGDGNLIAVGQAAETVTDGRGATGVVYLFRRIDGTWRRTQKIIGNRTTLNDSFGYFLKLDDAGRTLIVMHQTPANGTRLGTLEVYRIFDDSSTEFVHDRTIQSDRRNDGDFSECPAIALSGDGKTLARSCTYDPVNLVNVTKLYSPPGWTESGFIPEGARAGLDFSYDGSRAIVESGNKANIYIRGPNGYTLDAQIVANRPFPPARRNAISRDGKIVALGDANDTTVGLGPIYPPYQTGGPESGKVTIYERKSTTGKWLLRRVIKPGSTNAQLFGSSVALGDNGKLLVVGAPRDASKATGIDGDRNDDSVLWRGAAWIY